MNMSPPRPVISGSVSPCTAHAATAASTALPPDFKTRMPASDASACPDAIMPLSERTTGRHVDVCATGATESREIRLAVSSTYRRIGPPLTGHFALIRCKNQLLRQGPDDGENDIHWNVIRCQEQGGNGDSAAARARVGFGAHVDERAGGRAARARCGP